MDKQFLSINQHKKNGSFIMSDKKESVKEPVAVVEEVEQEQPK